MKKVVIYVHEESNKIVSKVCEGCGEIKLSEDFPKLKTAFASKCNECIEKGAK